MTVNSRDVIFHYDSPLGRMTAAFEASYLVGLWFDGQKHFGSTLNEDTAEGEGVLPEQIRSWLDQYFDGTVPGYVPPLRLRGTSFQQTVWSCLLKIPWGKTVTYGELAKQTAAVLGRTSMSAQAVGSAVGRNPISIIVPCHRVIGADGSLIGYAGGLTRKEKLLSIEGRSTAVIK